MKWSSICATWFPGALELTLLLHRLPSFFYTFRNGRYCSFCRLSHISEFLLRSSLARYPGFLLSSLARGKCRYHFREVRSPVTKRRLGRHYDIADILMRSRSSDGGACQHKSGACHDLRSLISLVAKQHLHPHDQRSYRRTYLAGLVRPG